MFGHMLAPTSSLVVDARNSARRNYEKSKKGERLLGHDSENSGIPLPGHHNVLLAMLAGGGDRRSDAVEYLVEVGDPDNLKPAQRSPLSPYRRAFGCQRRWPVPGRK